MRLCFACRANAQRADGALSALDSAMRAAALMAMETLTCACTRVDASRAPVQVDMAHVDLRVSSEVTLHIDRLRGSFVPVQHDIPYLDDNRPYAVAIDTGQVTIDLQSLNVLMAQALSGERSNVEKLKLSVENGKLRQQGVIDSTIDVPFRTDSEVGARIRSPDLQASGFPPSLKLGGQAGLGK